MVFLGVYKNNRLVSNTFLKPQIDKFRAVGDYCIHRAWNAQFAFIVFGEVRIYAVLVPFIYFYFRYHHDRVDAIEQTEKSVIERWGGSVDAVRKNLTPGEQVIAKNYAELEKYHSFFGPKDLIIKPAGCPLPSAAH
eukprot:TRINITY_DN16778_c0_g1_i2.p1 TRINITY_DN16778_c0_g1~~TRINITY_DN16778_c0_g1_i2.p1  ORF type:complete len:136 (-),score=50.44 TRINITY_DN16778_c0_g1_i2:429-836(-)